MKLISVLSKTQNQPALNDQSFGQAQTEAECQYKSDTVQMLKAVQLKPAHWVNGKCAFKKLDLYF